MAEKMKEIAAEEAALEKARAPMEAKREQDAIKSLDVPVERKRLDR